MLVVVVCGCLPCGLTSIHGEGVRGVGCDAWGTGVWDGERGVGKVGCWVVHSGGVGVGVALVGAFVGMGGVGSGGVEGCVTGWGSVMAV